MALNIPSYTPSRTHYTFLGWSESPDALTASFSPGDPLPERDLILYAVWRIILPQSSAAVLGVSSAEGDSTVYEDVFLTVNEAYKFLSIVITYPDFLKYQSFEGAALENAAVSEHSSGTKRILEISFADNNGLSTESAARLGRLWFTTEDSANNSFGNYEITVETDQSYYVTMSGGQQYLVYGGKQSFQFLPYSARGIAISGPASITKPTTYTVLLTPEKTTDKRVAWTVDDTSVAVVDSNGTLSPKKNGTVTLRAVTQDGTNLQAEYPVTVSGQKSNLTALSISNAQWVSPFQPDVYTHTLYIAPDTATVVLTAEFSSGTLVCDGYGYVFSGIGKTIYIDADSDMQTIVLTKNEEDHDDTRYTFSLIKKADTNTYKITYYGNGGSGTMADGTARASVAFVLPQNGFIAPAGQQFKAWKINGTEYPPGEGVFFTEDTAVTAVWEAAGVSVNGVTLNPKSITLSVGQTQTLEAVISPDNATDKTLLWSSSDTAVATVAGGKVTAEKTGTAVITVETADGSFTDTCSVNVTNEALPQAEAPLRLIASYSAGSRTVSLKAETTETITLSNYDVQLQWDKTVFSIQEFKNEQPEKFGSFDGGKATGKIAAHSGTLEDVSLEKGTLLLSITLTCAADLPEGKYGFSLDVQEAADAAEHSLPWKGSACTAELPVYRLSEERFENRAPGLASIEIGTAQGDFTVKCKKTCIVLYNNGTAYQKLPASPVPDIADTYSFELPVDYNNTYTIIVALKADLTADGAVTSTDALQTLRCAAGNRAYTQVDILIADINGDNKLTSTDALQILRYAVGNRTLNW